MNKWLLKLIFIAFWTVCLMACSTANDKPLAIQFSTNRNSLIFSGIDPAGLLQLKNTPNIDTGFAKVLSVAEIPAINDSTGMEIPVPGKLQVTDSNVVFLPLRGFTAGKRYRVESYLNVRFANPVMLLSGKLNHGIQPQQVILVR